MNRSASLLLAIIVIAIPITASALMQKYLMKLAERFDAIEQQQLSTSDQAVKDLSSLGTKTYTNIFYGYSFEYEAEASLMTEEYTVTSKQLAAVPVNGDTATTVEVRKPGQYGYNIDVKVEPYTSSVPLKKYIEQTYHIQDNMIRATGEAYDVVNFDRPITQFEEIKEYGVPAYILETNTAENPHFDVKIVFVQLTPTQLLTIEGTTPIPSNYQHGFDVIMKSFKLLPKTMTYRSDNWKLSFEYPGEARIDVFQKPNEIRVSGPYPSISFDQAKDYGVHISQLTKPSEQKIEAFINDQLKSYGDSAGTMTQPWKLLTVDGYPAYRVIVVDKQPASHYLNMVTIDEVYIERSASQVVRVQCDTYASYDKSKPICDQVVNSLKFFD